MGDRVKYPEAPHTEGEGWRAVVSAVDSLRDEIGQRHVENTSSIESIESKLSVAIQRIDDLHKAFPGGDWDSHRRYHQSLIDRAEAKTSFYRDLRSDLAKKGLWIVIITMGGVLLQYARTHIRIFY